ncbi:MAG: BON domain-containing protein [Sphingobacteriia bacterium]|nr:BON domain-containing protein [Sphingobacteriia bacterium]
MTKLITLSALILNLLALSGCVEVVATSAAGTGFALAKEKSIGTQIDDFAIRTKIHNDLLRKDINNLFANINVKVSEGKVLLTGAVKSPEDRVEAVRISWQQKGVKEVINEILIEDSEGKLAIGEYSKDSWITTQIKTKLLFNQNIRSVNYNIETIKGVVYILGISRSHEELELVNSISSRVKYVKKVVSYVRVKSENENISSNEETTINNRKPAPVVNNTVKQDKVEPIRTKDLKALNNSYNPETGTDVYDGDSFDD